MNTALNQPLRAKIELLSVEPDDTDNMRIGLASPETFERVGIDRPFVLTELQFKPAQAEDGHTIVKVTTRQPVREPFLNFLVEVEWPNGRLLREYTVLLDPPVLMDQRGGAIAQAPVVTSQAQSASPATTPTAQPELKAPSADQGSAGVSTSSASADEMRNNPAQHTVVSGDTLGEIAQRYRADDNLDLSQMMMAIFRANPDAFSEGNINNLKAGEILRIPASTDIATVDEQAALAAVMRQTNLWRKYKADVAEVVPSASRVDVTAVAPPRNSSAAEPAGAATTSRPDEMQDAATPPSIAPNSTANNDVGANLAEAGQLEIMAPKGDGANAQAATAGTDDKNGADGSLARERVESQRVEIEALNSKVAELESMVVKQARIISLQSKALADVQRRLASNGDTAGTQEQARASENASAGENVLTSEAEPDTAAASEPVARAASDNVTKTQPVLQEIEDDVVAPPSSSLMQDILANPAMLAGIGGGALLLLALVWLVVRRTASKRGESVDIATYADEGSDNGDSVAGTAPPAPVRSEAEDSNQESNDNAATQTPAALSAAAIPADTELESATAQTTLPSDPVTEQPTKPLNDDTLAEADVYIAYALYQQAEDVLKEAIGRNPKNDDYRLKLLETHYAAKNRGGFDAEAQALNQSLSGSPSPVWDRVMIMGRDLSPHNPLFYGSAVDGSGVHDSAVAPSGSKDAGSELNGQTGGTAGHTSAESVATSEQTVLNSDNAAQLERHPGDLSGAKVDDAQTKMASLTYDDETLKLGATELKPAAGELSAGVTQTSAQRDESTLDFDLSELEINDDFEIKNTGDTSVGGQPSSLEPGDEDLELADNVQTQMGSESASGESFSRNPSMGELQVEEQHTATSGRASFDLDDSGLDDLENLSSENGVGTKLDLARAYIDMGDSDGALSTLEEVLEQGDEDQRKEAEVLKRKIA